MQGMKRKWLYLGLALGLVIVAAGLGLYAYRPEGALIAPRSHDGQVNEPYLEAVPETPDWPSYRSVTSESWSDEQGGHVRLSVKPFVVSDGQVHTVQMVPPEFSFSLIRVGDNAVWNPSLRFSLLANGQPVEVSFPDGLEDPVYFEQGVKAGMEETLAGDIAAAGLKQLGEARHAQIRLGEKTIDLSPKTQALLLKLLAD